MIFACPSFKNQCSAKSGSLQDDDPFQNPIGPLYRWAMSIGIRTRVDINSSINLNCLLNTLKAPNLPSIREYPSLSWCHFEYFVSRHWFFVQATPTIQQLGKSTLDPPQEWLPIFSHNHGSVKNGYISNRIVTFLIQGPIFRWGRKGRTPSIPPKHPTHCNTRDPQTDHKWRFQIEGDRSPTTALWSYHGGTHEQEHFLLEQFVWMGLGGSCFSFFPTIVVFHQKPLKHVNSEYICI